jgi:SAM-dependent methyltransferase
MFKRLIKAAMPRPVLRNLTLTVKYGWHDAVDFFTGGRPEMVPPRRMIFVGGQDFIEVGDQFLSNFKELGKLSPDASVLDIGCGIGRMARPLTSYLSKNGRYEGFDIDRRGIEWCQRNITPKFPQFNFQCIDIYNEVYNPKGKIHSTEFRFPYPDESSDFIFLTSVFTHMFPPDVANYTKEIARVLRKGGRSLITYFLWNEESKALVKAGKSSINFRYEINGCMSSEEAMPEAAISLPQEYVETLHQKHGLAIQSPIHYGSWCGRSNYLSYQDIVVASKT